MDDDDDNEEKKEQTTPADNVGVVKTADTNGSNAGAAVVMTKLDEQYRPVSGPEAKTSAPASPKSAHSKDSSQRQQHQRNPSEASVAARIDAAPVSTAAPSSTSVWMERESSQEVHAHWQEALHSPSEEKANDIEDAVKEAKRHLGLTAANHLEKMGESLLDKDAPLLWKQMCDGKTSKQAVHIKRQWLHKLMTLATRCCATVEPNVKKGEWLSSMFAFLYYLHGLLSLNLNMLRFLSLFVLGDLLDIRPYVKIKVIPGGSYHDSAVSHDVGDPS